MIESLPLGIEMRYTAYVVFDEVKGKISSSSQRLFQLCYIINIFVTFGIVVPNSSLDGDQISRILPMAKSQVFLFF